MTSATMTMTTSGMRPVGEMLRQWRERRRLSQMALALDAEVSTRHLSFLETGRARPSRAMLLRLAEHLSIPLRDRNALLLAAGYAPAFPERALDDPAMRLARQAVEGVLTGHEPFPALAIDRHWNLIAANRAVATLLAGVSPDLLQPAVNVLRLSLHPDGLAPRIVNLRQWRGHLLERVRGQIALSADPTLAALLDELQRYPVAAAASSQAPRDEQQTPHATGIAIPLVLQTAQGVCRFISTTMVFGSPLDVTLAELAIEAFFPADTETAARLPGLLPSQSAQAQEDAP